MFEDLNQLYWLLYLLPMSALFAKWIWDKNAFAKSFHHYPEQVVVKALGAAVLITAVWGLTTLALIGPIGDPTYQEIKTTPRQEILFLVDTSASMGVTDMGGQQSRLDVAKRLIQQMLSELPGRAIGLTAFTTEVLRLSPLTWDHYFVHRMVEQMRINEGDTMGTDLQKALETVSAAKKTTDERIVVLFSDGGEKEVRWAPPKGVRLLSVGLGSLKGGKVPNLSVISTLNEAVLRSLRGEYTVVQQGEERNTAGQLIQTLRKSALSDGAQRKLSYQHYFQWPLALAILILLYLLQRKELFYA